MESGYQLGNLCRLYRGGVRMIVKEFFKERTDGVKLYRCLQDHTSQETWTPDTAPSLWVAISDPAEEWPAWVKLTGAHDAYAQGDKVSHNGKHWISNVDNNVWEPGVYGWTEAA